MVNIEVLGLVLHLAQDVEKLLKQAGVLHSLEKHPVVVEIEKILQEAETIIPVQNPDVPQD